MLHELSRNRDTQYIEPVWPDYYIIYLILAFTSLKISH